ncbi:hypothetical protein PENTCL1PPCAC_21575, partial [Pristionchus entomophagus]
SPLSLRMAENTASLISLTSKTANRHMIGKRKLWIEYVMPKIGHAMGDHHCNTRLAAHCSILLSLGLLIIYYGRFNNLRNYASLVVQMHCLPADPAKTYAPISATIEIEHASMNAVTSQPCRFRTDPLTSIIVERMGAISIATTVTSPLT